MEVDGWEEASMFEDTQQSSDERRGGACTRLKNVMYWTLYVRSHTAAGGNKASSCHLPGHRSDKIGT